MFSWPCSLSLSFPVRGTLCFCSSEGVRELVSLFKVSNQTQHHAKWSNEERNEAEK